jgi:hypothetical protein
MDTKDLESVEKHIVSAYERIERQRRLLQRLQKHGRYAGEVYKAKELLGVMQAICKQFRVNRRLVQQDLHRSDPPA